MAAKKLTKWQRHVKSTAKANPNKSFKSVVKLASRTYGKSSPSTASRSGGKRGKSMAKKNNKKRKFKIPLIATLGATAGIFTPHYFATDNKSPLDKFMAGETTDGFHRLVMNYLGYDTYGNVENDPINCIKRARGLHAAILGGLGSAVVSKLGINRRLSFLPFIKL